MKNAVILLFILFLTLVVEGQKDSSFDPCTIFFAEPMVYNVYEDGTATRTTFWYDYCYCTHDSGSYIPYKIKIDFCFNPSFVAFANPVPPTVFYFSATLQFKYGDYSDCLNVINPKLSKEYSIVSKSPLNSDSLLNIKNAPYILTSEDINLKQLLDENEIGYFENETKYNLNQLIIRSRFFDLNGNECQFEYTFPICMLMRLDKIVSEW